MRKETDTKKRFEFMTGETDERKFYNGKNLKNIDAKLNTFSKSKGALSPQRNVGKQIAVGGSRSERKTYSKTIQGRKEEPEIQMRNSNDRYSSVSKMSKADALSRALDKVLSDKRSSAGSRRVVSSSVSRL